MGRSIGYVTCLAVLAAAILTTGCTSMMFWRAPMIKGDARMAGQATQPAGTENQPITVNFIQHEGTLDDTLVSVETDPLGRFQSPELVPGVYTVEAMLPGYVVAESTVEVKNHEHRKLNLTLYPIGEAEGRTMNEAEEENIKAPGEVQIGQPHE
jgi:hypothetical protein